MVSFRIKKVSLNSSKKTSNGKKKWSAVMRNTSGNLKVRRVSNTRLRNLTMSAASLIAIPLQVFRTPAATIIILASSDRTRIFYLPLSFYPHVKLKMAQSSTIIWQRRALLRIKDNRISWRVWPMVTRRHLNLSISRSASLLSWRIRTRACLFQMVDLI